MKKRVLLIFLIILLGMGFVYSQTITVTSPHSGDTWVKGQRYTIKWTKSGNMNDFVKIRLYQGNTKILGIVDRTENDGSYDWTVPNTINPGTYKIRVKTVDNQVYDDSGEFTIANPQPASITITSPHTGDTWTKGQRYTIRWTKSGSMNGFVKIRLYQGNTKVLGIVDRTENDGIYDWTVPDTINPGTYKVRVKTVDNQVYDDSENFTIAEAQQQSPQSPDIKIINSLNKETIYMYERKTYRIKWNANYFPGAVEVELVQNTLTKWVITDYTTANYVDWTVPSLGGVLLEGDYYIRIRTIDRRVKATYRVHLNEMAKIIIMEPDGSKTWYKGQQYQIRFSLQGVLDKTGSISLFKEVGNRKVLTISPSYNLLTGRIGFTVPKSLVRGKYFVRIRTSDGQITGDSPIFWIIDKIKGVEEFKEQQNFQNQNIAIQQQKVIDLEAFDMRLLNTDIWTSNKYTGIYNEITVKVKVKNKGNKDAKNIPYILNCTGTQSNRRDDRTISGSIPLIKGGETVEVERKVKVHEIGIHNFEFIVNPNLQAFKEVVYNNNSAHDGVNLRGYIQLHASIHSYKEYPCSAVKFANIGIVEAKDCYLKVSLIETGDYIARDHVNLKVVPKFNYDLHFTIRLEPFCKRIEKSGKYTIKIESYCRRQRDPYPEDNNIINVLYFRKK